MLLQWHPRQEFDLLRHRMDRLIADWMSAGGGFPLLQDSAAKTWRPAVELQETSTNILLKAELPGIAAKDLEVEVMENAVAIAGQHHQESQTENHGTLCSELRYGAFERVVPLPTPVNYEQVKATFQDGILTLTLPKRAVMAANAVRVNLEDQLRDTITQHRQQEAHQQAVVHQRVESTLGPQAIELAQDTRNAVTQERQQQQSREEAVHMRMTQT